MKLGFITNPYATKITSNWVWTEENGHFKINDKIVNNQKEFKIPCAQSTSRSWDWILAVQIISTFSSSTSTVRIPFAMKISTFYQLLTTCRPSTHAHHPEVTSAKLIACKIKSNFSIWKPFICTPLFHPSFAATCQPFMSRMPLKSRIRISASTKDFFNKTYVKNVDILQLSENQRLICACDLQLMISNLLNGYFHFFSINTLFSLNSSSIQLQFSLKFFLNLIFPNLFPLHSVIFLLKNSNNLL